MSADSARNRPRLVLHDEPRVLALFATVYEQPVDSLLLVTLRRVVDLWNEGEPALAQLHLSFAGLPPCGPDQVLRLFVAEALLEAGASPEILLKAQGLDPGSLAEARAPLAKASFNPAEPRDARGWWTQAGATEAGYRPKQRWKRVIDAIRDLLRPRRGGFEAGHDAQSPGGEAKPETSRKSPASAPENQAPVYEPPYPLPRPGKGEPVNIPGLPSDIKGVDITNRGAKETNYKTELTSDEFEAKLLEQGTRAEPRPDGEGTNYLLSNGSRYFVRDKATTHDGPTADYYHGDGTGKIDMKLRLRE